MSDQSRSLPEQPNLRFLKLEAKRRLTAGEFTTLHDAQLAVAREHGMSSWTALKAAVEAAAPESNALPHVRWLAGRFQDADSPAWVAPSGTEVREHFDDHFLTQLSPDTLIETLRKVGPSLRADIEVSAAADPYLRVRIADIRVETAAAADAPHRLTSLRISPLGDRVSDERTTAPANRGIGDVPALAIDTAAESFTELGLVGLVLAGSAGWVLARGWADIDQPRPLLADHRFPAYGVTKLITSAAVLRLVADGAVDLDGPANRWLATLRLADDQVTVRELLSHTGGVTSTGGQFADHVPDDLVEVLGEIVPCESERGTFGNGNAGYAVLGQLVADVTGTPYRDAVARLVFAPLAMTASSFPTRWPATGAVAGYHLTMDGSWEPVPAHVHTMPAAGGMWTTATDLVRFGQGWSSLLPDELSREALRPHAAQHAPGPTSVSVG